MSSAARKPWNTELSPCILRYRPDKQNCVTKCNSLGIVTNPNYFSKLETMTRDMAPESVPYFFPASQSLDWVLNSEDPNFAEYEYNYPAYAGFRANSCFNFERRFIAVNEKCYSEHAELLWCASVWWAAAMSNWGNVSARSLDRDINRALRHLMSNMQWAPSNTRSYCGTRRPHFIFIIKWMMDWTKVTSVFFHCKLQNALYYKIYTRSTAHWMKSSFVMLWLNFENIHSRGHFPNRKVSVADRTIYVSDSVG